MRTFSAPFALAVLSISLLFGCSTVTEKDLADLRSPNGIVRECAVNRISRISGPFGSLYDLFGSRTIEEKAVELLIELLLSEKEPKKVEAGIIKTLGKLGRRNHVPVALFLGRLDDSDPDVHAQAIVAVGQSKDKKAWSVLVKLMDVEPEEYSIIWALGEIGDPRSMPVLNRVVSSGKDKFARYHARRALMKIGTGDQVEGDSSPSTEDRSSARSLFDVSRMAFQRYQDVMKAILGKIAGFKKT